MWVVVETNARELPTRAAGGEIAPAMKKSARSLFRLPLSILAVACSDPGEAYRPLAAGDPAPAYAAADLSGDTLSLSALRGQAVLLNVWATWCAPCRHEMPGLQALHERYAGRGLRVVGVSVDTRGSDDPIRRFVDEFGISFTILFDPADAVSRRFRINAVPETFLIDAQGRIVHHWIGQFEPLAANSLLRVEAVLPTTP